MNKKDELADMVDGFARTCDFEFDFEELLGYVWERMDKVDEDKVYDLAASSSYLFESWSDDAHSVFVPRRMFFQGAEFRITPTPEEVEGGYLFPGHRFMPFISRDIFPPDAWLVLPDGLAPRVRRVSMALPAAMNALVFYGGAQAGDYLATDHSANERRLAGKTKGKVEATVFDLQDFYAKCGFKPGDSLMLRVLDWLQGVYAVSHVPASQLMDLRHVRRWTEAMRGAYDDMQGELGTEGDCYEQFAIMLLLGSEDGECPLMKNPPLSIAAFFNSQEDIAIKPLGNRSVLCGVDEDPASRLPGSPDGDAQESDSELDGFFKLLGLPLSEGEAEAYMRGALYEGGASPDAVLARVCAGRSLYFRSAEDQETFHGLWCRLWEEIKATYLPKKDPYGITRAGLLALSDRCLAAVRELDRQGALDKVVHNPVFGEFSLATASLSSMLEVLNTVDGEPAIPSAKLAELVSGLTRTIEDVLKRLQER